MGGLEKLDVALAKLLRSEQASKSRVEAAASAAVKLSSAYSEDVVDRLVDFFSETGEDGKLTAFYVVGAVLDMERKALKTHYLADLFATRMKSILDKFYRSSEKEKDQVSKVLGRWKRYKIFDEKKLREWARSSGCCVGLEEKASQEKAEKERKDKEKSKSRRVGFKDDPESPPPARTSRQENDSDRPRLFDKGQGDAARSLLSRLASEKKSTKSDGDVLDLSRKRSFDEDRTDQKRQRIAPPVGSGPPPLGLPMPGVPPQSLPSFPPPPPPSFPQTSPRAPPSMQAGARGVPRAVSNAPAPPSMPPMPPPVPPPMPPMPGMSGHPPPAPPPVAPPAPPPVAPPAPPPAPPMPPGPPATTETKSVPTSWGGIPAAVKPTTHTGSDAQQKASGWSSFGGGASKSSSGTAPAATGGWGSYTK